MDLIVFNVRVRQRWSGTADGTAFQDGRGKPAESFCPDTAPAMVVFLVGRNSVNLVTEIYAVFTGVKC